MVNDREEEEELKKQMQQLELQNTEVAGDEDLSDSSDEGDETRDPSVKPKRPELKDDDEEEDEDAAASDRRPDSALVAAPASAGDSDGSGSRAAAPKARTANKT